MTKRKEEEALSGTTLDRQVCEVTEEVLARSVSQTGERTPRVDAMPPEQRLINALCSRRTDDVVRPMVDEDVGKVVEEDDIITDDPANGCVSSLSSTTSPSPPTTCDLAIDVSASADNGDDD